MKLLLTILFSLCGYLSFSQNCDCTGSVINIKCKDACAIKLLQTGTGEQLKKAFKLDDETVKKIVSVPGRAHKQSVEDFQDDLSYKRYIILVETLNYWQQEDASATTHNETLFKTGPVSPLAR